jgi:hypothetical protein
VTYANAGQPCRADGSVACVDSDCLLAKSSDDGGVCTAFLAEGAPCDVTSTGQAHCATGLECSSGKCAVTDLTACH